MSGAVIEFPRQPNPQSHTRDRAMTLVQMIASQPAPESDAEAAEMLATVMRAAREVVEGRT